MVDRSGVAAGGVAFSGGGALVHPSMNDEQISTRLSVQVAARRAAVLLSKWREIDGNCIGLSSIAAIALLRIQYGGANRRKGQESIQY